MCKCKNACVNQTWHAPCYACVRASYLKVKAQKSVTQL